MRSARPPQDRKFGCPKCEKKFFTPKDLRRHENTHLGLREHVCPSCQTRFGRKDHLTRHAKKSCQAVRAHHTHSHHYHAHPVIASPVGRANGFASTKQQLKQQLHQAAQLQLHQHQQHAQQLPHTNRQQASQSPPASQQQAQVIQQPQAASGATGNAIGLTSTQLARPQQAPQPIELLPQAAAQLPLQPSQQQQQQQQPQQPQQQQQIAIQQVAAQNHFTQVQLQQQDSHQTPNQHQVHHPAPTLSLLDSYHQHHPLNDHLNLNPHYHYHAHQAPPFLDSTFCNQDGSTLYCSNYYE